MSADHLRVCGADNHAAHQSGTVKGSPPRVRSRQSIEDLSSHILGITSACAEQTYRFAIGLIGVWDHLRVCGADNPYRNNQRQMAGSPPRVRSRRRRTSRVPAVAGITSACAEQTCSLGYGESLAGDHLRVCGADSITSDKIKAGQGSPPRVRSRPDTETATANPTGITSACAEQTRWA